MLNTNRDFLDAYEIASSGDSEALAKRMFELDKVYPGKGFKESAERILKRIVKDSTNHVVKSLAKNNKCSSPGCNKSGTMGRTVRAIPNETKWYCSEHWS